MISFLALKNVLTSQQSFSKKIEEWDFKVHQVQE